MSQTIGTQEIGTQLVELIKAGKTFEAIERLYADDIQSIEAMECGEGEGEGMPRTQQGKPAIIAKNEWWYENMDVHSADVEGPFPHEPDRFALIFNMDATCKQTGNRMQMREIGLYTVSGGRIVKEEFFYAMPG